MARKKKTSKKKASKKKTKNSKTKTGSKFWVWFKRLFFLGTAVGVFVGIGLAVYAVHLNKTVVPKFEGRRWSVPSQVYAQPQELYVGNNLSASQLESKLKFLGYKRSQSVSEIGTYQRRGDVVKVHVRPFQFWDADRVLLL